MVNKAAIEHTSQYIWTFEPNIHTQIYTPQHDEDPRALGCVRALWQQLLVFHNAKKTVLYGRAELLLLQDQ